MRCHTQRAAKSPCTRTAWNSHINGTGPARNRSPGRTPVEGRRGDAAGICAGSRRNWSGVKVGTSDGVTSSTGSSFHGDDMSNAHMAWDLRLRVRFLGVCLSEDTTALRKENEIQRREDGGIKGDTTRGIRGDTTWRSTGTTSV